jgi:hypothetical protein
MEESPQHVEREVARWEEQTGHSVDAVVNADPTMPVEGLTEAQRREANELWERRRLARGEE